MANSRKTNARPGYNTDNSLNVAPTGTPVGRPNPHTSTGFSVNAEPQRI